MPTMILENQKFRKSGTVVGSWFRGLVLIVRMNNVKSIVCARRRVCAWVMLNWPYLEEGRQLTRVQQQRFHQEKCLRASVPCSLGL
uniref:Uncharacterized protein n=1 Tax=Physcomitrium patens TaxID=3218 RepID=A0A2K1L796_PHYPA|nr:hypothetical protein PHYPA_000340 [Physcomitrium patens]